MNKIFLFNTLGRKIEEFKATNPPNVGIYECGPTVYDHQHVGNLRRYIFGDILVRVLLANDYKVKRVMNITDVGHLTSDADYGQDKIEESAKIAGKKAEDIVAYYWQEFRKDLQMLNILEPTIWCKATDHIKEQIALVKTLEQKGYTYKTSDGIYFDTTKPKNYRKFAKLKAENFIAGTRVAIGSKRNHFDFALWKFSEKPGERQQEWPSPWGIGFPGWHIECSAMAMKYLGEHFDIHTGGEDHIPIHHTNEIAQSEAATGNKFANYWMHSAFLTFKGIKASKSKGGLFTISELKEIGFDPLSFRYFVLNGHYRTPLEFSIKNLEGAQNALFGLKKISTGLLNDNIINKDYLDKFSKATRNDLQTPKALSVMWTIIRDKNASGKYLTLQEMDKILGLDLFKQENIAIPPDIRALVKRRETARKNKDWDLADKIRNKINKKSYDVEDSREGPQIIKIYKELE